MRKYIYVLGSNFFGTSVYIYIIYNIINNSRRKDKGNQWHDGGCICDTNTVCPRLEV